jgi:NADH-quinone oxidoreductase subunit M
MLALGLLAVAVLGLGLYPAPVVDAMHSSVSNLLLQVAHSKILPGTP